MAMTPTYDTDDHASHNALLTADTKALDAHIRLREWHDAQQAALRIKVRITAIADGLAKIVAQQQELKELMDENWPNAGQ